MRNLSYCIILHILLFQSGKVLAQDENYRPDLLFREDFKEIPAELPVNQKHISNPDLILTLYGPGQDSIKKSHHDQPSDDPYYIWSGRCIGTWALTLKCKNKLVDLSGYAKIKWRTKQSGFRQLHIIIKLYDGTWLISDLTDGSSKDWRMNEFNIMDINWYILDINRIVEKGIVNNPDLTRVDEIGFTDLMPGGESYACSRIDWIEVYAKPVKR